MSSWNEGYVTDIGYTYGYYDDMNPLRVKYILTYSGYDAPEIQDCFELGIGQGMSINMHSATSDQNWYGNDFNPEQIAFAKKLAEISNAHVTDESFEELCQGYTDNSFDYICLHGIWSWISDTNRKNIVKFCKRNLRVNGVLYISYNTRPGHNPMVPIRKLMIDYLDKSLPENCPAEAKVDAAYKFIDELLELEPKYFSSNPQLKSRIDDIRSKQKEYVAHEYFNRDWNPMDVTELEGYLSDAKLSFATNCDFLSQVKYVNFTAEQLKTLANYTSNTFSERVGDYINNIQFRKDLWVKGANKLPEQVRLQRLKEQYFTVISDLSELEFNLSGHQLQAQLQPKIYEPIIELLKSKDVISNGEIHAALSNGTTLRSVCEATMILCAKKVLLPANDKLTAEANKDRCRALNAIITEISKYKNGVNVLASPLTGSGILVSKFSQMFVNLLLKGDAKLNSSDLAAKVSELLDSSAQKINHEGKTLNYKDSVKYLEKAASKFLDTELPYLRKMMIVD